MLSGSIPLSLMAILALARRLGVAASGAASATVRLLEGISPDPPSSWEAGNIASSERSQSAVRGTSQSATGRSSGSQDGIAGEEAAVTATTDYSGFVEPK